MQTLDVKVGDKIYFKSEKLPYTVRARNERFIICTKPFNARKTVLYTIIDLKREVRGRCNLIFCPGFETDEDIADAMKMLQQHCDEEINPPADGSESIPSMEVSYRHFIELDILKVRHV